MSFKKFLKKNIEASNKGTETQQDDMAVLVAESNQAMGELSDQLSGRRNLKDNKHHNPRDLADATISDIEAIIKLRRQIEK